ncbi:hypothetical protein PGTUg99_030467 [Puccinia graminis f. sp. tritici]|uniref:Uncharacterized protein n=1 Tax=Puccinia graminis f. sp. tritici TaxID=56615 RepID=A0A5B0REA7_PUCGR|nr:hypothetical protein PGTUg99_030467 [Puccinia graminis f. sp. tritici]
MHHPSTTASRHCTVSQCSSHPYQSSSSGYEPALGLIQQPAPVVNSHHTPATVVPSPTLYTLPRLDLAINC